jgi:hypothetical protein
MARARFALFVVPAVLVALCAGGCNSWKVTRLARFEPGRAAVRDVHRPAPRSAAYKVQYASASGDELRTLGGTRRIVGEGKTLGFTAAPDGTVVAVAGEEQIPLDKLPSSARFCVWTCKERRPTQFTREVGKAAGTVGGAALTGGAAVGIAALHIATHPPRRSDKECEERESRRGLPKGYRWVGPEGKEKLVKE